MSSSPAARRARAVLNTDGGETLLVLEVTGDQLALLGDNGKALIFPVAELPEMPRGKGVKLQSYREGGLKDGLVFKAEEGPVWPESPAGGSASGRTGRTGRASAPRAARRRRVA